MKLQTWSLHIIFWLSYVAFKAYINFNYTSNYFTEGSSSFRIFSVACLVQFCFLLVKVPLVYFLFYVLDRALNKKIHIVQALMVLLFSLSIAVTFYFWIERKWIKKYILIPENMTETPVSVGSIIAILFILGFVVGLAFTAKLIRMNLRARQRELEITKQKLETELSFLKSQTNPHFLFNTLNNIYALARKKSDETATSVMQLSKLLRFMIYESRKDKIPISEEIQILEDYINLEKIRYTDNLKLTFNRSIDQNEAMIAPLMLLPFIENAFKHGASENRFGTEILIDLSLKDTWLDYKIENSITSSISASEENGLGLKNIRRQLELLYPRHELTIEHTAEKYKVHLRIELK